MVEDMCKIIAVRVGTLVQKSMHTFRLEALFSDDEWVVEDRMDALKNAVGTSTTSTTSTTNTNTNTNTNTAHTTTTTTTTDRRLRWSE